LAILRLRRHITHAPVLLPAPSISAVDGKHVVFGKVLDEESMRLVTLIEGKGSSSGKPTAVVEIADCGELPLEEAQAAESN
jgi:hypothetical protein